MNRLFDRRWLGILIFFCAVGQTQSQPPGDELTTAGPISTVLYAELVNREETAEPMAETLPPEEEVFSMTLGGLKPYPESATRYRYIDGSNPGGFGIQDLELSYPWHRVWWGDVWPDDQSDFSVDLIFNVHWWDGPKPRNGGPVPSLPARVYDLALDFKWRPRITEWLLADLAVSPGLHSDFHTKADQAFRVRGHAQGIICFTERIHVVLGVDYLNRETIKLLPVAGLLLSPDDDTRWQLVFPNPRLSHRLGSKGETDWWAYISGEYGGGAWAYRPPDNSLDYVEYNDYRIMLGLEWATKGRASGYIECGCIFNRELNLRDHPDFQPGETFLVGVGFLQ